MMAETESTRSTQTTAEIAAPAEAVWRALTEPTELVRWFPLAAEVEPGAGGTVVLRWEDLYVWRTRIEIWEPNRQLRLSYEQESATSPKSADPIGGGAASDRALVVDFQLEAVRGGTILRLVHSGFGRDSSWDDEYEGVKRGWLVELASLKHYLEHHFGEPRRALWVFVRTGLTAAVAWSRLIGGPDEAGCLVRVDTTHPMVHVGDAATPLLVVRTDPGGDIVARVPSWNDALLRIFFDPAQGGVMAGVFVSLYGAESAFASAPTRAALVDIMRSAFPENAGELVVMEQ